MKKIIGAMIRAIKDYKMIVENDKVAVGLSGGKDSTALLCALATYRKYAPFKFDIVGININMGFDVDQTEERKAYKEYVESLGVEYVEEKTDISTIIFDVRKEKSPCSLCSKMRRGALHTAAVKHGCNKVALGHHADDVLGTMLLSFFYEGRLSTFSPVSYLDRTGLTLIRPFIYVDEKDIKGAVKRLNMPVLTNPCPEDKHTEREKMKEIVDYIKKKIPIARDRMISAIEHPERYNLWRKP